nr:MAG TPA: hypothetical protein [Caudoviricetes sp.]
MSRWLPKNVRTLSNAEGSSPCRISPGLYIISPNN